MSLLIGKKAPRFKAKAVVNGQIVEDFSFDSYLGQKYILFFFYPKDFTFVCPTELLTFQKHLSEFADRNVAVVGCSTDTEFSHWAWLNTPRNKGGIEGVTYPIVADTNKTIANAYDVLAGEYLVNEEDELEVKGECVAFRGLFLIDKEGIVQHQLVNNMPLGRSVKEAIRIIDALQHFEAYGEVCPMDWEKGKKAIEANPESVADYLPII